MFVCRLKHAKASGRYGTLTKPQKEAADRFATALHRLEIARKSEDLADDVRLGFPLDEIDFERWRARAKAAACTKLDGTNPNKPNAAKLYAAEAALRLLEAAGQDTPLTRKGPFCRLAAILYGDPRVAFLHHCRAVKADRHRV
jgi:hypothetical protein